MQNKNLPIDKVRRIIESSQNFVITTHVSPDGDGLGCEIALLYFLEKLGKSAVVINVSETPGNYKFLDPENRFLIFDEQNFDQIEKILNTDVIFICDMNQSSRLKTMEKYVLQSKAIKIIIDHHLEAQDFADYYLIDVDAPASGEIVYKLIKSFDGFEIDKKIATGIYTAIMTDTGSFRFPRTDSETHRIVADLLDAGADPVEIYDKVYEQSSLGRIKLLGKCLSELETRYDGRLGYIVVTQDMLKNYGVEEWETDGFVQSILKIAGVRVAIFILELKDGIKLSFRSKGEIPINELAKEFGGNGHKNAAGARLYNITLDEVINQVIQKAEKYAYFEKQIEVAK
ncbi:phosphoesterase RecJ domain-containing protein [Candidatus Kryptonium thompsonii]|jgi:phosphoesterase RecJ-like protein|uniref:Phosphoesterase RecJ domain-containing protein n=1 Tax=Candidatus Kryptonium thompsonii TaxID=1633631 RepID=A0A0P1L9A6_9BACT|nr:bifunctional oligoribonuclease/PAP phosphatase NrnA [Candidatus Kryptonium thompsoni]CUS77594.1 phosphoesterase RecJ domain-containing protein [Candidatus Kryptonium thompsoni]CUS81755.1 phosphoesterase RecJ domain-containing protein [Candidatus Kryptonium thompsoni]CUS83760.1 phosphoesterase RecJ domain-containing protein [Candidatus Kryptonium thompsoni]CUS84734.1 phosphoesterase RecJ domain-containing protein [Candidatus Kryptonium thompsoni]CUS85013.1 phosphoesterase RecJ domain-contain